MSEPRTLFITGGGIDGVVANATMSESIRMEETKKRIGVTLIAAATLRPCDQPSDVDVNEILVRPAGQEV